MKKVRNISLLMIVFYILVYFTAISRFKLQDLITTDGRSTQSTHMFILMMVFGLLGLTVCILTYVYGKKNWKNIKSIGNLDEDERTIHLSKESLSLSMTVLVFYLLVGMFFLTISDGMSRYTFVGYIMIALIIQQVVYFMNLKRTYLP